MISKQEVQHIAKLARLGLTQSEIEKFQRELSKILDYIEKLGDEDKSSSTEVENIMREDEVKSQKSKVKSQKLMELAPETKNGYLKTKPIL